MAAKRAKRPASRSQVVEFTADKPAAVERMLGQLAEKMIAERKQRNRVVMAVDLTVGENKIAHRLGRPAIGMNLAPSVADASFAWSFAADGDKFAVITVVGIDQPACAIEFW